MNTLKILLAEDDLNLGFVIQDQLKMNGFTVHLATDGKEGLKKFNSDTYHLCVLDVMMPEKDGFSLAKDIRKINKDVPILFLTAKSQIEDKIEGFKVGGDDYLTKPFSAEELTLRIRALLKRANIELEQDADIFEIGEYHFDSNNYQLTHPNFEKKLTKKEADILKLLCKNKNKVLPRDIVLNSVWGQDDYFVGRSLDVFITKLRKYLKEDSSISISNVHGVGFKLEIA
ncbi:MAG: response regulator transcription factor [Crocinitomicaceae bacterium]|nr:response regulator transcription factor [Crocinitomicaceae bacterium]